MASTKSNTEPSTADKISQLKSEIAGLEDDFARDHAEYLNHWEDVEEKFAKYENIMQKAIDRRVLEIKELRKALGAEEKDPDAPNDKNPKSYDTGVRLRDRIDPAALEFHRESFRIIERLTGQPLSSNATHIVATAENVEDIGQVLHAFVGLVNADGAGPMDGQSQTAGDDDGKSVDGEDNAADVTAESGPKQGSEGVEAKVEMEKRNDGDVASSNTSKDQEAIADNADTDSNNEAHHLATTLDVQNTCPFIHTLETPSNATAVIMTTLLLGLIIRTVAYLNLDLACFLAGAAILYATCTPCPAQIDFQEKYRDAPGRRFSIAS